jgi:hypothetical protein
VSGEVESEWSGSGGGWSLQGGISKCAHVITMSSNVIGSSPPLADGLPET